MDQDDRQDLATNLATGAARLLADLWEKATPTERSDIDQALLSEIGRR